MRAQLNMAEICHRQILQNYTSAAAAASAADGVAVVHVAAEVGHVILDAGAKPCAAMHKNV